MPAHRKPTNILEMNGSVKHDPQRYRNRTTEPKPGGVLGSAPKHFDAEHKAIWKELVKQIAPGVLTVSDRIILEMAVRLTHQMRQPGQFTAALASQLRSCLGSMAMTPSDRSKVNLDSEHGKKLVPDSPFKKFAS